MKGNSKDTLGIIGKMKQQVVRILPEYAWLPIIAALLLNALAYFGTRLITTGQKHYDLSITLDHWIPIAPVFIVIYWLAYVQWIIGFIMTARESKAFCYRFMISEMTAKMLALFFFLFLPTTIARPQMNGNDVFSVLTRLLYQMDAPDQLFPSVHCLESWFCLRSAWSMRSVSGTYKWGMFLMTIAVFLSTVFLKQHVVVDIAGGILVLEAGFLIERRFFRKWENKILE